MNSNALILLDISYEYNNSLTTAAQLAKRSGLFHSRRISMSAQHNGRRLFLASVFLAGVVAGMPSNKASAQATWPDRPVKLIVASAAGGNADVIARLIAAELEKNWKQPVVIENLAGASGMQGTEAVSKATADGYTLLVGTSSQLVFNMATFDPMPVDLPKTLRGVVMMNKVPLVLLVNKDEPARTMQEYITKLKATPGILKYGSGPQGTTTHVVGMLWAKAAGVDVGHIPYRAGSEGLRDLMAGRLSHQFDVAVTAIPQAQSGTLKPLAVTSRSRLASLPDVPTVIEAGLNDFEGSTWNSVAAPSATPQAVVDKVNRDVTAVLAMPAIRERLVALGSEISPASSPAEVDAFYAKERAFWIPIVRDAAKPKT